MKYIILLITLFYIGCGNKEEKHPEKNNSVTTDSEPSYEVNSTGIGPIEKVELGALNEAMIKKGEQIFNSKCIACHTLDEKRLGPPLRNITQILRPEFIMNYLLNTQEMQQKDEYLKGLIKQYNIIMPDQNLTETDARSVLEYLRSESNK